MIGKLRNALNQLNSVNVGDHHVGQDNIELGGLGQHQGIAAGFRVYNLMSLILKLQLDGLPHIDFIFNKQDPGNLFRDS